MTAKQIESQCELAMRRGYYLAVANLMRLHDQDVMARDVLRQYGKVDFKGIDPLEIEILKPIYAEMRRRERAGI